MKLSAALRGIVVLLAVLSVCTGTERSEVAFFETRSGDIILKPKKIQDNPFLLISTPNTNAKSQTPLEDTNVAELISYLVGGPIIQSSTNSFERDSIASAVEGLSVSVFDKSKANLLVSIAGVGSEVNEQFSSMKLLNRGKQIPLTKTSYPQDTTATMATLATGRTPTQHGIVGKLWKSSTGSFAAYRAQALPIVASVSDIISQSFGGQSLVVSASGCYQMASSMAVHQYLHSENPFWNNMGFYFNSDSNQFESLYTHNIQEPLTMSKNELIRNFAARKFSGIQYLETRDVVVTLASGETVQFDFAVEDDFLLFAELEFALSLLDQLKNDAQLNQLVKDNTPDLYSISISSIARLKARYGNNSPQVAAAMAVLDQILNQIIDGFSALYNNKLSNEVIFLGSKNAVNSLQWDEDLKDTVYPVVRKYVKSQEAFNAFFPVIYLDKESYTACDEVGRALPNYVEVYCPEKTYSFPYVDQIIKQSNNSNNTNDDTNNRAASFQICLWMSIVLVLFAFGSVYALYAMDIGADSLLYRMTSGKLHNN